MENATTTLIADDEEDMLLLVRLMLRTEDCIEVVAEATDGQEAVERFTALGGPPVPDVVVMDNRMPRMTGIEAARRILAERPGQRIVLYSAHLDDAIESEAAQVGITACLDKQDIDQLPALIWSLI